MGKLITTFSIYQLSIPHIYDALWKCHFSIVKSSRLDGKIIWKSLIQTLRVGGETKGSVWISNVSSFIALHYNFITSSFFPIHLRQIQNPHNKGYMRVLSYWLLFASKRKTSKKCWSTRIVQVFVTEWNCVDYRVESQYDLNWVKHRDDKKHLNFLNVTVISSTYDLKLNLNNTKEYKNRYLV